MADSVERIKTQINAELSKTESDIGAILSLASQLAKSDPDYVRFSIDAAHISRLGRELVSRQETAVAELVKNAYDADATEVTLSFENSHRTGGCLTVTDTGNGMSREQLVEGFMRLSTSDKRHNPYSEKYGRARAGRKGIGRFAAQRLGKELVIITQRKDDNHALKVRIDWNDFVEDRELGLIANKLISTEKVQDHGTILIINDLRDSWTEAQIRRVYRFVLELIQPFPLSRDSEYSSKDPGFTVACRALGQSGESYAVADEKKMLFDHSLAVISGSVDSNGQASWTLESRKLGLKETSILQDKKEPMVFPQLEGVNISAHYFIYKNELVPRQLKSKFQDLANEKGGIQVYRNGFRVRPYGEPYNDWLRLDYSSSNRHILPPHSNQNFFGFVELHDPDGERFEETASREGLIENDAYKQLVTFASTVLKAAVLRIAAERKRKQKPSQSQWNVEGSSDDHALADAISKVEESVEAFHDRFSGGKGEQHADECDDDGSSEREALSHMKQSLALVKNKTDELLHEIEMLRVLASLGLTIGEFTHEIKHYFPAIRLDIDGLHSQMPGSDNEGVFQRIDHNLRTVQSYASYFDATISANVSRERRPQELRDVISDFVKATGAIADRASIQIETEIDGYDLFTVPMHYSEWASVFNNLFTNSKKAILRAGANGRILIKAGLCESGLFVEFSDNGCGIDDGLQELIFEPFYTTSIPVNSDYPTNEASGTGLGLKLVKDIVGNAGGSIRLVEPPDGFQTTFRIELKAAVKEEIDDYED